MLSIAVKNLRKKIAIPVFITLCIFSNYIFAEETLNDDDIPLRFRKAFKSGQKRTVDVFFNGEKTGKTKIKYRHGLINFLDVPTLMTQLTSLKPQYLKIVETKLETSSFKSNYDLLCPNHRVAAKDYRNVCQYAPTKDVMVVYNTATNQIFLYVNPTYAKPPAPKDPYITTSKADFSALSVLNGNYTSNMPNEPVSFNLNAQNYFSKENFTLQGRSSYFTPFDEAAQLEFDQIFLSQRSQGKLYQYGMIQSFGNLLFQNQYILGASVSTDYALLEGGVASITPVELYLSEPTSVRIFQQPQGRLIYSQQYFVPGNYVIDTYNFPQGSYNIEIQTEDSSKRVAKRQMFFIKSELFPDPSTPKYDLFFGFQQTDQGNPTGDLFQPYDTNQPILMGNYVIGLPPSVSFVTGVQAVTDQFALSLTEFFHHSGFTIQINEGLSSNLDRGISSNINYQINSLGLVTNLSYYEQNETTTESLIAVAPGFTMTSGLNWNTDYKDLSISLSNSYQVQQGQNSFGLQLSLPVFLGYGFSANAGLGATVNKQNNEINISISFFQSNDYADLSASLNQTRGQDRRSESLILQASKNIKHETGNSTIRLGNISNSDNTPTQTGSYNYFGPMGTTSASFTKNSDQVTSNLLFNTSLVYAGGHYGMGQNFGNTGALIVVNSKEDLDYTIINNRGGYLGEGNSDMNAFISISPYVDHQIDILLQDLASNESNRTKEFMLYPGNVQLVKLDYIKKIILIGQVYQNNMPVDGQLTTLSGEFLQDVIDGSMHITIPVNTTMLQIIGEDNKKCLIDLPSLESKKEYKWISKLECKTIVENNDEKASKD